MRAFRHVLSGGHGHIHGVLHIHGSVHRDRRCMHLWDHTKTYRDELHEKHSQNSQPDFAITIHPTMHGRTINT